MTVSISNINIGTVNIDSHMSIEQIVTAFHSRLSVFSNSNVHVQKVNVGFVATSSINVNVSSESDLTFELNLLDLPMTWHDTPYAFVDGSYNATRNIYSYGGFIRYYDHSSKQASYEPFQGVGNSTRLTPMHNIAGELEGAKACVKKAIQLGLKKLILYYDYEGIEKLATGESKWKCSGTQSYSDFMRRAMKQIDIQFVKVKAHSGILGNERADQLAKGAIYEMAK